MSGKQVSPTVALRLIASELKRLRGERPRAEVEEALLLKRNALYRYENSESPMQDIVAKAIFEHYGLEDEKLDTMLGLVRASRSKKGRGRGMVKGHAGAGGIPAWFEDFVILERDASQINALALTLIPGRLQTEDYARAVLQAGVLGTDVEDHVRIRMERAAILDGNSHPRYWAIISESVLRRPVGGKGVMRAQLEHLAAMAQRPGITVQILSESVGAHISMTAPFVLFKFDAAPQFGVVYLEYLTGAIYRDDPKEVTVFDDGYRHLMTAAASETLSLQVITRTIKELYS